MFLPKLIFNLVAVLVITTLSNECDSKEKPAGYIFIDTAWPQLKFRPLHEVKKEFTDKWPFAKFKIYQHGYNGSEECYGYIKIVCIEDIVVQPPTYKAMEPDMEKLHFVVGQKFSPLIEQIKEKFPTVKIGVAFDGKPKIAIRNSEERQYILVEIANNNRVYFAPRFERFPQ